MKLTEKEIENLIYGIDENETKAWKNIQAKFYSGWVMPTEEIKRRKEYKKALKQIFTENNVTPDNITDAWIAHRVKKILQMED